MLCPCLYTELCVLVCCANRTHSWSKSPSKTKRLGGMATSLLLDRSLRGHTNPHRSPRNTKHMVTTEYLTDASGSLEKHAHIFVKTPAHICSLNHYSKDYLLLFIEWTRPALLYFLLTVNKSHALSPSLDTLRRLQLICSFWRNKPLTIGHFIRKKTKWFPKTAGCCSL